MFLSKIFNLRHIEVLDALSGRIDWRCDEFYLNLGCPRLKPPRVRGSMMVFLANSFLADNSNSIQWGSVFDTGALSFGCFGEEGKSIAEKCKLPREEFLELLSEVSHLERAHILAFAHHKPNERVDEMIARYFGRDVLAFSQNHLERDFRNCELCFTGPMTANSTHLLELFCPNTYINIGAVERLQRTNEHNLTFYNPRFGIEGAIHNADRFDRYL